MWHRLNWLRGRNSLVAIQSLLHLNGCISFYWLCKREGLRYQAAFSRPLHYWLKIRLRFAILWNKSPVLLSFQHAKPTVQLLHTPVVEGESNWKNSIASIESYAPFFVAQVGFYILRRLNDRPALGGLIFNRAQMLDWECLHCMNNGCLSEGVAWGLLGVMRIKVARGFTALLIWLWTDAQPRTYAICVLWKIMETVFKQGYTDPCISHR